MSVANNEAVAAIKTAVHRPLVLSIELLEQAADEVQPEDEVDFQDEISEFLANHRNRSFDKKDQSEYANFHYRKDITGFTSMRFTNEERAHINAVIDDTFTNTKASRDLLTVAFDKDKKNATVVKAPSDPFMLHKIIAFHVVLVLIALVFFKVSG